MNNFYINISYLLLIFKKKSILLQFLKICIIKRLIFPLLMVVGKLIKFIYIYIYIYIFINSNTNTIVLRILCRIYVDDIIL